MNLKWRSVFGGIPPKILLSTWFVPEGPKVGNSVIKIDALNDVYDVLNIIHCRNLCMGICRLDR